MNQLSPNIRIAIVSDLHCKHSSSEGTTKSTLLYSDDITGTAMTNPIKALKELIKEKEIETEILLCPGDIADKADPQGLTSGWGYLEAIQRSLNAKLLIATIGNHDVNVKCAADQDPNDALRVLDANFPAPNLDLNLLYWQFGFCIYEHGNCAIFIFNSCYSHHNAESGRKSFIDHAHLENVEKALIVIKDKNFNHKIAMCHHHPINHGNLNNPDVDLISNGDDLVDLLEKYGFQVVIHGHKHEPRLSYKNSVPVFCAGSLSSTQNVSDLRIENTFHVMELHELENKGTIESWVLIPKKGWIKKMDTFFPCYTGFGFRGSLDELAGRCAKWLIDKGVSITEFRLLREEFKEIDFLTPNDQHLFNQALLANKVQLTPELPNQPKYIGLIYSKND